MAHPYGHHSTNTGTLLRRVLVALTLSLGLLLSLLAWHPHEASAQGTAPTAERDSPSSSSVSLETDDFQTFTATGRGQVIGLKSWSFYTGDTWRSGGSLNQVASYQSSITLQFTAAGTYTVRATFTDLNDETGSISWRVTVSEENEAPNITSTSPDRRITLEEDDRQTFRFTATDDDNNITQWSFYIDGDLETGGSLSPTGSFTGTYTHRFTSDGRFDAELIVTDSEGETDSYEWDVTVEEENDEPNVRRVSPSGTTVNADVGDTLTFTASATDRDDNISEVEWTIDGSFVSGQSLSLTGSIEESYTHTFSSEATYRVEVEFTDTEDESDDTYWRVVVGSSQGNSAPSASHVSPLSSLQLDVGDSQTFTAMATDVDDNISQVEWFVNGQSVSGQSLSLTGSIEESYTHTFSSRDNFRVEARFTDSDGLRDSVTWQLSTNGGDGGDGGSGGSGGGDDGTGEQRVVPPPEQPNRPPLVAPVSPLRSLILQVGDSQEFIAMASDDDGNLESVEWFINGVSAKNKASFSPSASVTRSFIYIAPSVGHYRIRVVFTDSEGASDYMQWEIQAVDPAPQVDNLGCTPGNPETGEPLTCNPQLSGGAPAQYSWTAIGAVPTTGSSRAFSTHWDTVGPKQITLEVCDSQGNCDSRAETIQVLPPTPPPQIASLGCTPSAPEVDEYLRCIPELSGGPAVSYYWTAEGTFPETQSQRNLARSWRTPGDKELTLKVCNRRDVCDFLSQTVTVGLATPPPQVDSLGCTPTTMLVGGSVDCTPTLSGGTVVRFNWSSDDGTPRLGYGSQFFATWDSPGAKVVQLQVCDAQGVCANAQQTVTVNPLPREMPIIHSLGCSASVVGVAEFVTCSPDFTADGPVDYDWSAPGGSYASTNTRSFTTRWPATGQREISLSVCAGNLCDTAAHPIEVVDTVDENRPPVVTRVSPNSPPTLQSGRRSARHSPSWPTSATPTAT